jgi:histidine triad (HIT) family protein
MVIPRTHVADLSAPGAARAVVEMAPALEAASQMLVERLAAQGVSLVQSSGSAAGQEVFHLHMHLIPRWTGDAPLTMWSRNPVESERVVETHRQLVGQG